MKNALYLTISILLAGSLAHFGLPWWTLVLVAALAGWIFLLPAGRSFAFAFIAGALLWYSNAYFLNTANEGLLASKVGQLFQGLQGWQLLVLTGFLGGLLAGFGALTGCFARDLFVSRQPKHREI